MITDIASPDHFNQIIRQGNVCVVDYHAAWCGPSNQMLPEYKRISEMYGNVNFYKVDVDAQTQLTQEAGARVYPTFVVYRAGTMVQTIAGANPTALKTGITHALSL